jgi:hypothetical protein
VRNRGEDSRIVGDGEREEKNVTPHKRAAQHLANCAMIGAQRHMIMITVEGPDTKSRAGLITLCATALLVHDSGLKPESRLGVGCE